VAGPTREIALASAVAPAGTTELGIDIIKVERIRAALERFGPRFSKRVLTEAEQRYVRDRPETLAGRWAAKEAVSKVLGLGVRGIGWRDIEIERLPPGQPAVRLHGRAAARADQLGMERIAVSITMNRNTRWRSPSGSPTGGRFVFPRTSRIDSTASGGPRPDRAPARHGRSGGAAALASDAPIRGRPTTEDV
jgi:holo-[acyl-carrier protein] synthase